ncbi:MAG TPA: ABC transporter ATP-binding protein [Longimicrobium sp.]
MTASAAWRFTRFLARLMPRRIAAAVALSLSVTAAEAAGVLLLAQLLALAGVGVPDGAAGALTRTVEAAFRAVGARPSLSAVLLVFVVLAVALALLQRAQNLVANRMELQASLHVRTRLYDALARARWLPLARARGADLLTLLTTEVDRIGSAAAFLLTLFVHGLLSLAYLAVALRLSPVLTAIAMACGALLLMVLRRQRQATRRAGQEISAVSRELMSAASEHLGALKVVKSYGAEERNARIFADVARRGADVRIRAWATYADARAAFLSGSVVMLAVVLYVAVEVLRVSAPTVLLLVFVFYRLVPRLAHLQAIYQMLSHDLPAWEQVTERIAALEAEREALSETAERTELAHSIRLEGVSFAYGDGRGDAVDGLTLEIEARRTTAVVGPSGAGKTTVADLVTGLVQPREGRIVVDGRVLDEGWLRAWRAGIGYVAQDTLLFNDTVLANLRWARPQASEAEVWEALRLAAADGFVRAMPDGLATQVGDRGVRLSGGERQRLALARALLRRPALLILDEATSALDAENERRIRDAIRGLHGRMTILVITHRLPSVRDADVVHVMEGGRWVESGTWEALMERPGGRFRRLWASQAGERTLPETEEVAT